MPFLMMYQFTVDDEDDVVNWVIAGAATAAYGVHGVATCNNFPSIHDEI